MVSVTLLDLGYERVFENDSETSPVMLAESDRVPVSCLVTLPVSLRDGVAVGVSVRDRLGLLEALRSIVGDMLFDPDTSYVPLADAEISKEVVGVMERDVVSDGVEENVAVTANDSEYVR